MKYLGLVFFWFGLIVLAYGVVERILSIGISRLFSESTELYFQFSIAILIACIASILLSRKN
jgi:uncharacterized membrane protein